MLLLAKIIAAPLLIWLLTFAGRRFGPAMSGLLMGIPLITGPVSFFSTVEQGADYAQRAAAGNLAGQVSTCLFCLAFALVSTRQNVVWSALAGIAAFIFGTMLWNQVQWSLWPATLLLLCAVTTLLRVMPVCAHVATIKSIPRWDLPLRMTISAGMVLGLTKLAGLVGPQLSGLIAPFPTFVLILAVFTQIESGRAAAADLVRGVVLGSLSFTAFFVCVGVGLQQMGLWIYPLASFASVAVSAAIYRFK